MKYEGQISENFSWNEFQRSSKAEELGTNNNIPDESIASQVRSLVVTVLQPLRSAFGKPLHINSGYRCPALNKVLKGAKNSQHTKGQAVDIASDNPFELAELVLQKKLPFDQMILYKNFLHVSHKHPGSQRGMVLYDEGYEGERIANAAEGQK